MATSSMNELYLQTGTQAACVESSKWARTLAKRKILNAVAVLAGYASRTCAEIAEIETWWGINLQQQVKVDTIKNVYIVS